MEFFRLTKDRSKGIVVLSSDQAIILEKLSPSSHCNSAVYHVPAVLGFETAQVTTKLLFSFFQ